MNRREFMSWVGVGSIASSLPVALAACSPQVTSQTPQTSASPVSPKVRSDGFKSISTLAALDQQGQLSQKINDQPILVLRNPGNAKAVLAVDPTCTHKGCTVAWKMTDQAFVCPCHSAKFASDGKVLKGPAPDALKTYTAKIEGDQVLVKVG